MLTKSWLTDNNIPFLEKNVEQAGIADELMALGYKVTPVIFVEGGESIVGYSPSKLAQALL